MDYGVESQDHHYGHMIQSFHRFLLDNLAAEANAYPYNPYLLPLNDQTPEERAAEAASRGSAPSSITQVCGVDAKNIVTCTNCGAARGKDYLLHVIDLIYPKKVRLV